MSKKSITDIKKRNSIKVEEEVLSNHSKKHKSVSKIKKSISNNKFESSFKN
jgi:hypothetical protein